MSKIALAGNASGTGTITLESPNTNSNFTITLPAASGTLVTTGGTVTFGAGTVAAPSITNTADTNTGIYFPAADTIGFTEGGAESLRLNSSGNAVFAGSVTVAGTVQVGGITTNVYPLVSGTAVSASGTAIDFTGIPPWVRRITVMFNGISTNGTSNFIVQLGNAGGIETTSYSGGVAIITGGVVVLASSTGFLVTQQRAAADILTGSMVINNVSGNAWVQQSVAANNSGHMNTGAGGKTLSGTLTQVRITTVNGTDAFDAGTINIMYE